MRKILFTITTIFSVYFVTAQDLNVSHVNVKDLLSQMPEMKSVQAELEKLQGTYTSDIQASIKELQTKSTTYQNEANLLSQEELQKRSEEFQKKAEELQKMESNIQQAQRTASQELQKKQQEMLAPVMKKVQDAIEKVAKEKNITYVFDASPGGSVIVAQGQDLLPFVRKELGF